jgi:hypothetical protein
MALGHVSTHATMTALLEGERLALAASGETALVKAARLELLAATAATRESLRLEARTASSSAAATLDAQGVPASAAATAGLEAASVASATAAPRRSLVAIATAMTAARLGTRRRGDRQSGDTRGKK